MNNENTPAINEVIINGVAYVPKYDDQPAEENVKLPYCIVRSHLSGVIAGYLQKKDGETVVLLNARHIWSWSGLSSLSNIAAYGTSNSDECNYSTTVPKIMLTMVDEIIYCTDVAEKSILTAPDYQEKIPDNQIDTPDNNDVSDRPGNSKIPFGIHAKEI